MKAVHTELPPLFFTGTAESYDRVVHGFTLGLDFYWKRAMYKHVRNATRILDLACGTGILTIDLAKRFPNADITGVDITPGYLDIYKRRILEMNIKARGVLGNAEEVLLEGEYDTVISSYIPKYVNPDRLLSNVCGHIRAGGLVILHDFTLPRNPVARFLWEAYNRFMNWIGIRLFPEWHEVFSEKLTLLIRETNWFEEFQDAFRKHGFELVEARYLSWGSAGLIVARKIQTLTVVR